MQDVEGCEIEYVLKDWLYSQSLMRSRSCRVRIVSALVLDTCGEHA